MIERLPRKVMVDTGVFIRWLGNQQDHKALACSELVETLLAADSRIYLAAPALAEVLRWGSRSPIPRRRELIIAAFDELAARILGEHFPLSELEAAKADSASASLRTLKFDSMIVACAIRHKVDVQYRWMPTTIASAAQPAYGASIQTPCWRRRLLLLDLD